MEPRISSEAAPSYRPTCHHIIGRQGRFTIGKLYEPARAPYHMPKKKQAKLSSFGRKVLRARKTQTGTSDRDIDKGRKAMSPGKRRSASGRIYYEATKNRSDIRGRNV